MIIIILHPGMVVVVQGLQSLPRDASAKVPQGNVLNPDISSCFINGLPSSLAAEVGMLNDDCTFHLQPQKN